MSFAEINWRPTKRELRGFAAACLLLLPAIAALLHYHWAVLGREAALIAAGAGAGLGLLGVLVPRALLPLYLALSVVTLPVRVVVGYVVAAVFLYVVLTPIGLILRLRGRDALRLRRGAAEGSYWVRREAAPADEQYFHQY